MTTSADISFWTLLAAVAGGVAALAAIISICWLLYKWKYRPRFLVGAIPFEIDKKYWMTEDPIDEATFNEDYFAIKYRCDCPILGDIWEFLGRCRVKFDKGKYSHRKLENLKKGKHALRCRTIEMLSSDQRCVALPLLLKNIGRMNAKKLRLAVNFTEQDIDILDIKTETFLVDALYSQNPEGVINERLRDIVPLPAIRDIYHKLDRPGAFAVVSGDLGTQSHEVLQLDLSIPANINEFHMVLGIDHTDAIRTDEYIQRIEISRPQE